MTHAPRPMAAGRRIAAALLALALAGCSAGVLPQVHSEAERLTVARAQMARRDYTDAIEMLKVYVQNNAGAEKVDEAIYALGECYIRTRDWTAAANEFERLTRDYPESDSAASAAFMLGESYWGGARGPDFDQEDTQKALDQWQLYLRAYPGHWRNAEAQRRVAMARTRLAQKMLDTATLYWKLHWIEPARIYYQQLVDDYGDTPLVGDALVGLALCDAREGKRAEAESQLKDLETRFAGTPLGARAAAERARVEHGAYKPLKPPKPIPRTEGPAGPSQ